MKHFILFVSSLFILCSARADFVINPDHSQILFSVSYLKISQIRGSFTKFRGNATLDKQGLPSSVELLINADSITTFDQKRDLHLKRDDFLAVNRFPEIRFRAEGTPTKIDEEIYNYPGKLEFLGKEHPLNLQLISLGQETDPWGKVSAFFQIRAELDRRDLGLHWNRVLDQGDYLVGEMVYLDATIQLQPRSGQTPFSTHMIPAIRAGSEDSPSTSAPTVAEQIAAQKAVLEGQDLSVAAAKEDQSGVRIESEAQKPLGKLELTMLEQVQIGFLAFFALIGIFATGIGIKFWLEKNQETKKRHFIGEVIFILLFFAYSTWLFTLVKKIF